MALFEGKYAEICSQTAWKATITEDEGGESIFNVFYPGIECHNCLLEGHYANKCPLPVTTARAAALAATRAGRGSGARTGGHVGGRNGGGGRAGRAGCSGGRTG